MTQFSPTNIEIKVGCLNNPMTIIGKKWTALILRDLFNGPKRFCQLEQSVKSINPRTLSQRLDSLEQQGIINKKTAKEAGHSEYILTKKGYDLLPILQAMASWGVKYRG